MTAADDQDQCAADREDDVGDRHPACLHPDRGELRVEHRLVAPAEDLAGGLGPAEGLDRPHVAQQVGRRTGQAARLLAGGLLGRPDQASLPDGEHHQDGYDAQADQREPGVDADHEQQHADQHDRVRDQDRRGGDHGVEESTDVAGEPGEQLAAARPVVPPQRPGDRVVEDPHAQVGTDALGGALRDPLQHHVEHAEERGDQDAGEPRQDQDGALADRTEQGQRERRCVAAESVVHGQCQRPRLGQHESHLQEHQGPGPRQPPGVGPRRRCRDPEGERRDWREQTVHVRHPASVRVPVSIEPRYYDHLGPPYSGAWITCSSTDRRPASPRSP